MSSRYLKMIFIAAISTVSVLAQQPAAPAAAPAAGRGPAPTQPMSFFVTSTGIGDGGKLGGIEGADRHCQQLATAVNAGDRTWRAYLSTQPAEGKPAINARERIGTGPWFNARGGRIAQNLGDLHGDTLDQARIGNTLTKATALNEKGEQVKGFGDQPNIHDILTGSQLDGMAFPTATPDQTCNNWTSNTTGGARVGHHDRTGGPGVSWNSLHTTPGCTQQNLAQVGGAGLLYCFAVPAR